LRAFRPRETTHEAGRSPEKLAIGSLVPGDRGAQQAGKLVFIAAAQACLPPIRSRPALCYVVGKILFKSRAITKSCREGV
jgi:hypothetical protein